jgi:hypothetical protein
MEKRYPRFAPLHAQWLKEDEDFRRWMDRIDGEETRSNYFYNLARLNEATKLTPKEIVARYRAEGQTKQKLIDDLDSYLRTFTRQQKYAVARLTWAAVTSLLIHRGLLRSARDFEIKQPRSEIILPQYIPTQEEFEVMLRYARSARNRFALAFFRYSGARDGAVEDPEPMRLYHILDLNFDALAKGDVEYKHSSSCAILIYGTVKNSEIVRYHETYVAFIVPQAMQLLKEYLEERLRAGEQLKPESYLFAPERRPHWRTHEYMTRHQIARAIFAISKAAGFKLENGKPKYGPHSLRRLFYNSPQGLEDVDREALQGHIKGVRARYHGTVDEFKKAVEFMRPRYEMGMRAYIGGTAEEIRKQIVIETARQQGVPEEKIAEIKRTLGLAATVDQLREALSLLSTKEKKESKSSMTNGGKAYDALLVDENDLVQYLETGWEVVSVINSKVAIRRPAH